MSGEYELTTRLKLGFGKKYYKIQNKFINKIHTSMFKLCILLRTISSQHKLNSNLKFTNKKEMKQKMGKEKELLCAGPFSPSPRPSNSLPNPHGPSSPAAGIRVPTGGPSWSVSPRLFRIGFPASCRTLER